MTGDTDIFYNELYKYTNFSKRGRIKFMENFKMVMFENFNVRSVYDEKQEKWYFSIVDIIAILTQQTTQRGAAKYWSVLKLRLKQEGSQLTTN